MLSYDPIKHTFPEDYRLLTGSIIPRPIAFVTSVTEDGILNGAPFSYFNIVSANPPMISISIQREKGICKDTARNIVAKREFVVHIVDEQNVDEINKTSATFPSDVSEIEHANLSLVESTNISVPGIKESKVRFECILERTIELAGKDEDTIGTDLIIGKVVMYHIDGNVYNNGRVNQQELAAVSRLAGSNYAKVGDVFSIKRPK